MMKFSNQYAKVTGTKYCEDKSVPAVVIVGLALHKETLGAPLCPCRHYEDKEKEVKDGYWNCPCVPMRERHECHCMLFLKDDNPFASECSNIDLEEIMKLKDG
ncbi:FTRC [Symbiodinium sp. CCMP2456]|nr:FTRC [Symbiodinium sp. CCMP2456]